MATKNNAHGQENPKKPAAGKIGSIIGGIIAVGAAGAAALGLFDGGDTAEHAEPGSDSGTCAVDSLPPEAHEQIEDILTGAPSDDGPHDGKHFGNYEGLLPKQSSNYYREYTVKTPGLDHRGARRIVVGGGTETNPETWYYTSDHYESFCEIPDAENNAGLGSRTN